jgi:hypothetical protein
MFSSPTHTNPIAAATDKGKAAENPLWDIRYLDAFPKTMDDFRVKTLSGAVGKFILFLIVFVCVADTYFSLPLWAYCSFAY